MPLSSASGGRREAGGQTKERQNSIDQEITSSGKVVESIEKEDLSMKLNGQLIRVDGDNGVVALLDE